jgi:anti-sigma factor RsiW
MSAYVEDELASRPRGRLRRHLDECEECRSLLASLRRMLGLLRGVSASNDAETPDIASAVRRRLHGE